MPQTWKTVRVFISSTFRDMHAERDHLVRFVFPRLREELLKRRIHLVDVDLRWGVTAEQDALEVCREIIDECRPRFICILGSRYGWTPLGEEQSITDAEVRYAVLDRLDTKEYRYFYFRDSQVTASIPEAAARAGGYREFALPEDIEKYGRKEAETMAKRRNEKLELMKQAVVDAGFEPYVYPARWNDQEQRLIGMVAFGERVYADLLDSINDELGTEPVEAIDEFDEENAAMEAFVEEQVERFVIGSRQTLLDELTTFAKTDGKPNILVLTGQAGLGKSALMSKFYRDYVKKYPGGTIISHFVGASVGSTDLRRMLRRFCHELSRASCDQEEIPQDIKELVLQFLKKLKQVASSRRIVLLIDALNQFDATDNAHSMYWLPNALPPGVRVIVSSLDHPALDVLRRRRERINEIELQTLNHGDGQAIVEEFLKRYHKRMGREQMDVLLEKKESGSPLYLLTALEELRTLSTYEEITDRIRTLPGEVRQLFLWILKERLSNDPGFRDQDRYLIGEELVRKFVSFLGVSRHGLSQRELVDLINPGDPLGNVAALQRLLQPYLMHRGELLDFYHNQLREAVEAEYLDEEQEPIEAHRSLAEYFKHEADPAGDGAWRGNSLRGLSELPYHQTQGRIWTELEATLCDLGFIEAKCAIGMTYDLVTDYTTAFDALPEMQEEKRTKYKRDQQISQYTQELICVREQKRLPLPKPPASVRVWTNEEIKRDIERITNNPTYLDRIRAFAQFVNSEAHNFARYALQPMFCIQQAYNQADSGPVAQTANHAIGTTINTVILLCARTSLPSFNPHPACLRTLEGHLDVVTAVGLSADGRIAVSGGWENILRVWDIALGQCLRNLEGHSGFVGAVSLTPDGCLAVSGSRDNTLRLWEIETGRCLQTLKGHSDAVYAVSVSPDGNLAVSGSFDNTLRVWDLKTGRCLHILRGHSNHIRAVSLSADGRIAVSGSEDRTLRVWEVETGRCVHILEGHLETIHAVSLSADGHLAISGAGWQMGRENVLCVWDIETGQCLRTLKDHSEGICAVSLSADGHLAVSGDNDKILRIWDVGTGQCIRSLEGHSNDVLAVGLSADGHVAVSGSWDKTLRVWNIETGQSIRPFERNLDYVYSVSFSIDGSRVFSGSGDRELPHTGNKALHGWDVETGRCTCTLEGHTSAVRAVGLAPDGHVAVSGSYDKTLRVWDLETGRCLRILEGHTGWVDTVSLTPDGRLAISGSADNTLRLWEVETGRCLQILKGHSEGVSAVSVSPDGKLAVSGSFDKTLRIWELETGQCLHNLEGHAGRISTVNLTPDGRLAVSGDDSKTIRIWDVETGCCIRTLEGHSDVVDEINSVSLTNDGRIAISASMDKTLRVWDIETGLCLAIVAYSAGLTSVVVKKDRLVVGDEAGNLLFFEIHNLKWGPSMVTPVRLWRFGTAGGPGAWDSDITVFCEWCSKRSVVQPLILDTIMDVVSHTQPNQVPCISLARGVRDEPGLLSECPFCHKLLKFNPFIVDNREEY